MVSKGHWKWQAKYIAANYNFRYWVHSTSKEQIHSPWGLKSKLEKVDINIKNDKTQI